MPTPRSAPVGPHPVEVGATRDGGRSGTSRLVMGLAWANLALQILIIVTGGVVRLTGSGLGCSTWPQCEPGQFTPVFHEAVSYHPFIEFGNRTMTGVLSVVGTAVSIHILALRGRPTESSGSTREGASLPPGHSS